jgi:hypothetical protein
MNSNISSKKSTNKLNSISDAMITFNGTQYWKINISNIIYCLHVKSTTKGSYSLVDCGAIGSLFGVDIRVLNHMLRQVTITGIYNQQISDLQICTGAGYGITQRGPVILIMHPYAYLGQGK